MCGRRCLNAREVDPFWRYLQLHSLDAARAITRSFRSYLNVETISSCHIWSFFFLTKKKIPNTAYSVSRPLGPYRVMNPLVVDHTPYPVITTLFRCFDADWTIPRFVTIPKSLYSAAASFRLLFGSVGSQIT